MDVPELLKRAQDMLVSPTSPPKAVTKAKQQDVDDWVDLNAAEETDSGWTTPSCASSQPGTPRANGTAVTDPAAIPSKAEGATAAIATPAVDGKAKTASTQTAGVSRAEDKPAPAPESPPQVSEGPSAAQLHHAAEAMAAGAGFTEADMAALKAMMSDLKGDIGRCTQVAEQALANNSRPNGRGQFAWRVGQAQPAAAAAPAPAEAAPRRPVLDLSDYLEVDVDLAQDQVSKDGFVISLKPQAGGRAVRLFVGDFEGSSLVRAVNKKVKTQHGRPLTYDFLKNSVEELGFKVAAVQVTAFINNTYHSLVQYESRAPGAPLVAVDSRPSDAINLALRFGAPVYVHKKVLSR